MMKQKQKLQPNNEIAIYKLKPLGSGGFFRVILIIFRRYSIMIISIEIKD